MPILVAVVTLLFASPSFVDKAFIAAQMTVGDRVVNESTMMEDRFWSLIAQTSVHEADPDRQLDALRATLRVLTTGEIEAFERAFHQAQLRAYTWDLWGAAYVLNGGASDDGFEYFERWLISKGRKVFEAALADPESLADAIAPDAHELFEFEEFANVAGQVWAEKTGIDPWRDPKASFPLIGAVALQPSGTPFEEDPEHLAKRYPKLWARFGTDVPGRITR
jgi:uncharacterized protein DUF4240